MSAAAVLLEVYGRAMRRAGKRGVDIAVALAKLDEQVARLAAMGKRRAGPQRGAAIGDRRQRLVIHLNQGGGILGNGAGTRDHDRDGFAHERDFVLGENKWRDIGRQLIGAKLQRQALGGQKRRQIGGAEHRMHAGQPAGGARVDTANAGMGVRAAHERGFEHTGKFQIIDKAALAADERAIFEPQHPFADGALRCHVAGRSCRRQSICTPEARTTACHFGRSDAMNAANASGVIGAGSPPTLRSDAATSGDSKMRFTSAAILSTIGRGVPAGANRPCHPVTENRFSVSPTVGRSGALGSRSALVTASARMRPDCACGYSVVMLSMAKSTLPLAMAVSSSAVLRNGTCVMWVPVACSNITTESCDEVPMPDEP